MMAADINLQVWLETVPNTHPSVIIPYVRSKESGNLHYTLRAVKQGLGGSSRIAQSGGIQVLANQPVALSRFSLSVGKNDQCRIELILVENGNPAGTYHFDCPR
ncbi:MAG TPA: curli-like amyloid fiber formation chaperone CsgH [Burkholderiaceae bacterium]|nr:curli-like amyloid fiber formation chaperone CsgH [Burkholderiaceae bacterium]